MNRWYDFEDDLFAEDVYSEEDFAFEKMTGERLAWKDSKPVGHGSSGNRPSSSRKDKLQNPSGSCSFPHQVGGIGSGDGTCYQKHQEHGSANAGKNGSPERAKYMKEYRKKYYDSKAQKPKNGKGSRSTVPRPFGKTHERGGGDKKASLRNQLSAERLSLLKLAYENPQIRREVRDILNIRVAREHRKSLTRELKNPRKQNCDSFMKFKDWTEDSWNDYMEELIKNDGDVFGECYNTHSDYGQWGGKSTGKDKAYQKWYNENVRNYEGGEYKGPKKGKNRTRNNRRDDMWRRFDPDKKKLKTFLKKYVTENQDKVPKKLLEMYGLGDKVESTKKRRGERGRGGLGKGKKDQKPQTQQTQSQSQQTQSQTPRSTPKPTTRRKKKQR